MIWPNVENDLQNICDSDDEIQPVTDEVENQFDEDPRNDKEKLEHEEVHSEKHFQCQTCKKCFDQITDLKLHERIHTHLISKCKICSKCFPTYSKLKRHEKMHTDERPFKCKSCSKCFRHSDYLKIHESFHKGKNEYQCNTCTKFFKDQSVL